MVQSVFNSEQVSNVMALAADMLEAQPVHVQRKACDGPYGCIGTLIGRAANKLYPGLVKDLQKLEELYTDGEAGYSEGARIGHDRNSWSSSWLHDGLGNPTCIASFNDTHTKPECVKAMRSYAVKLKGSKQNESPHQG